MHTSDMEFIEVIFSYIDELERCKFGLDQVRKTIDSLSSDCGFDFFTITKLPQPKTRLGPAMIVSKWPQDWLAHYDRSGFYKHDPIGRHCFKTLQPFLWSEVRYSRDDQMAARVMVEAAESGLRTGFCVPIHDLYGFHAVASFCGRNPIPGANRRRALHLLAMASYSWAERENHVTKREDRPALSPRERDVLVWLGVGLTNAEVADRLRISTLTVQTHVNRARVKLGASNTVSAVVEALRRREIAI